MNNDLLLNVEHKINGLGNRTTVKNDIKNYYLSYISMLCQWTNIHLSIVIVFQLLYFFFFANDALYQVINWHNPSNFGLMALKYDILTFIPLFLVNLVCSFRIIYVFNNFKGKMKSILIGIPIAIILSTSLFIPSFATLVLSVSTLILRRKVDVDKYHRYKFTKSIKEKLEKAHDCNLKIKHKNKQTIFKL